MKKKLLTALALAVLAACVLALSACSQWDTPYSDLDKEGADISVRFDPNGGMFASASGVTVVDVFRAEDYEADASGMISISLADPSDASIRGKNALELAKNGHVLAGWFVTEDVKDSDGRVLDEDGNIASESGKAPAKKIIKRWNFETDKLTVNTNESHSSSEPVFTLTAMWIPHVVFEFYTESEGEMKLIGSYSGNSLEAPTWSEKTGRLDYKKFTELAGKTLDGIYLDEELTEAMSGVINADYDYEKAVCNTPTVKIYTTWRDGVWTRVSKPEHLSGALATDGCYELMNDITFTEGIYWSDSFTGGAFSGKLYGNGHKITGIETPASISKGGDVTHGALFGSITSKAEIRDVTFENVTYTVYNPGGRANSSAIGLFAGENGGATVEGVSLVGAKIVLTKGIADFADYISSGDGDGSIKIGLIVAEGAKPLDAEVTVECLDENVTVEITDGGLLLISRIEQ